MRGLFVLLLALLSACEGARSDDGRDAFLRVDGAQFYRAELPGESGGPLVVTASLTGRVTAGGVDGSMNGDLDRSALSVAVMLEGDIGYWIVRAATPLSSAPTRPTFLATFAVSARLRPGPRTLLLRSVDASGRFGPITTRPFEVASASRPEGRFVVSLSWNNQADLDLHVVDPTGVEIWKRNINSYEPPPPGAPPEAPGTPHPGGLLDFDSNAQCVPDGRHAENVVYTDKPPSGHYVARVDTFSLCNEGSAHWRVEGFLDGVSLGAAEGSSSNNDTTFSHDRGAGVLALELDVP